MKKAIFWAVAGFLVIGLGTVIFAKYLAKPAEKPKEQPLDTGETLDAVMDSGKDYWCRFKNKTETETGMIYVSQGRFKVDYSKENGVQTHMAYDGNYYYVWGGNSPPFKLPAMQVIKDGATQSAKRAVRSAVGPETKSEVICLSWTVNEELLGLPKGTEFADFSQQLKNLKQATEPATIKTEPINRSPGYGKI